MSFLIYLLTGFIAFLILKTIREDKPKTAIKQTFKLSQLHKSVLIGCAVGMILCGIGMLSLATVGNPLFFQLTAFTSLFFWSLSYKLISSLAFSAKK